MTPAPTVAISLNPPPLIDRSMRKPDSLLETSLHARLTWLLLGASAPTSIGAAGGVVEMLKGDPVTQA